MYFILQLQIWMEWSKVWILLEKKEVRIMLYFEKFLPINAYSTFSYQILWTKSLVQKISFFRVNRFSFFFQILSFQNIKNFSSLGSCLNYFFFSETPIEKIERQDAKINKMINIGNCNAIKWQKPNENEENFVYLKMLGHRFFKWFSTIDKQIKQHKSL